MRTKLSMRVPTGWKAAARPVGWWLLLAAVGLPVAFDANEAVAADVTDVVDAADGDDPFDFHIEPRFTQTRRSAVIRREYPCDPSDNADLNRNPRLDTDCGEPSVVFRKEMDYERITNQLDIDVQFGLYKDVEFHLTFPLVFSDQRVLRYADLDSLQEFVDASNSSVDPSDSRIRDDIQANVPNSGASDDLSRQFFSTFRYFSLAGDGNKGPTRKGFGDMKLGIAWNPFNRERDDTKSTLMLGFDYVLPTGEIARAGNEGVGRGVHELQWTLAASKRFRYLEPYFSLKYVLPIAASNSLFEKEGPGQTLISPGQRAEFLFGSEFIPYEEPEFGRKFVINVGLSFAYQAEGRDYNPLFDALSSSECNGLTPNQIRAAIEAVRDPNAPADGATINRAACRWILDEPGNAQGNPVYDPNANEFGDVPYFHDGLLDHEAYATFGASLKLAFYPSEYVSIGLNLGIRHEQEHFITTARTGVDSDDDNDTVKFDDPNERNPHHNPNVDSVGNRFRVEETIIFNWGLDLALQF